MTTTLLETHYLALRAELSGYLGRLYELLAGCGRPEAATLAEELLAHVTEPFLFVVVGEVKAGKSSLINALLGERVTDVAPDPCTDRIRIISRGDAVGETEAGSLVTRVAVDNPLLDGLAIVDTPGVDSIIDRHQEITEEFIPRADLVLFAFSAINPYSRSAWEFFDLVADTWGRNVAFALTMADLASPEQIEVNSARLRELARARGLDDPSIFLVSAVGTADDAGSGVEALRRHIRSMTADGGHYAGKLEATRRSALRLSGELGSALAARQAELASDDAEARRIRNRLQAARQAAGREAEVLRTRVEAAYARLSGEFENAFAAELTLSGMLGRSITGLWRRGKGAAGPTARLAELGEAFARDLEREVEGIAAQGAAHIFESVSGYARMLVDELKLRRLTAEAADGDALSGQRQRVLDEVAERVEALLAEGGPLAGIDPSTVTAMDPRAALGGALVVLGTIFAVSVKSAVIDVTGGVVAALGAVLAGSALYWQRPRVLAEMRRRLAGGGEKLRQELDERLSARLDRIFRELAERFEPFFADIEARGRTLADCSARQADLEATLRAFSPR
ncbi:MAG: dynamin family protein [Acidobacteriota bacterium]